ncbi:unnamed protein product [Protopolystoma xenopodis]|uniref:Uncharacterized protein n=1 Tax=Protopolystoma xenopodis TaxID=117903 RepID=A0A448XPI8_9PLAT|nr:unnamed protein product [Protopolystoma xenopodis]
MFAFLPAQSYSERRCRNPLDLLLLAATVVALMPAYISLFGLVEQVQASLPGMRPSWLLSQQQQRLLPGGRRQLLLDSSSNPAGASSQTRLAPVPLDPELRLFDSAADAGDLELRPTLNRPFAPRKRSPYDLSFNSDMALIRDMYNRMHGEGEDSLIDLGR